MLAPEILVREAERRTGLSDWGDMEFIPRMRAWLAAAGDDGDLNDVGRASIRFFASQYLDNRLRLEGLMEAHPEIACIELPRPIVVTGLPRSGTTALATLLCEQPGVRWLPFWEALEPFSRLPEFVRRSRAEAFRARSLAVLPKLEQMHDCKPDSFTDDQELQGLAFGSYMLEWQAHVPAWRDRYLAEDQTPVYRYLKRAMQALTFLRGSSRWVIKSPQHMEQLPALATVFPDALLVVTRRNRSDADQSMQRLVDYLGLHTRKRPMPRAYWQDRFDTMERRYGEAGALFPGRIELNLTEWGANPAAVREIVHCAGDLMEAA